MSDLNENENHILDNKTWRKNLDAIVEGIEKSQRQGRERSLARTKLQEAMMWLGMDLRVIADGVSCYKIANDTTTTEIEDVPDGVHMRK